MMKRSLEIALCTILCFCPAFGTNDSILILKNNSSTIVQNGTLTELDFEDEDTEETWLEVAIRDIAYYLRNYKFNEWDRRYYRNKPNQPYVGFYGAFPSPSLKSIHHEVNKHCRKNFFKCITYLHKVIKTAPFTRNDDIVTSLNKNVVTINVSSLRTQNNDCKRAALYTEKTGLPFDGPQEKFIWRTSAAYYMCWYTLNEHPVLSMLGESCDNYAECLDPQFGNRNHDPRSNDMLSFACAMYSFCPDPCCPLKHVRTLSQCYANGVDPCYSETAVIKSRCKFDRKQNQNLDQIVENNWNVTCYCHQKGFQWDPQFGMCVDINECNTKQHNCDLSTENCLNQLGTFQCVCKWGFMYDQNLQKCVYDDGDVLGKFREYKSNREGFDLDMREKMEPLMTIF